MIDVVAAIIGRSGDEVFVGRRSGGRFAGRWEFPGGKVKPHELPAVALRRELREEGVVAPGMQIQVWDLVATIQFRLVGLGFNIAHYNVTAECLPEPGNAHDVFAWMSWDQLRDQPVRNLTPGMASFLSTMEP